MTDLSLIYLSNLTRDEMTALGSQNLLTIKELKRNLNY